MFQKCSKIFTIHKISVYMCVNTNICTYNSQTKNMLDVVMSGLQNYGLFMLTFLYAY